jgi:hypothetical protein
MTVTFDDGTTIKVEPKSRDMVGAEAAGHDFTTGDSPLRGMYATALAALRRMDRAGKLPEGIELPDTVDAFVDVADVDAETDEDPEGKG